jgi:hypothetical protein
MWPNDNINELNTFYGLPGELLQILMLPFPMRRAHALNDSAIGGIVCNPLVAVSLYKCLCGMLKHYGYNKLKRLNLDIVGDVFVYRTINESIWKEKRFSVHAFGAAIDINPDENQETWTREQSKMPEKVIEIFSDHGWTNAGVRYGMDFMHFQATK